eukprot:scaffold153_cov187-Pinguiococcus_pyrenoidosus.AAC.1
MYQDVRKRWMFLSDERGKGYWASGRFRRTRCKQARGRQVERVKNLERISSLTPESAHLTDSSCTQALACTSSAVPHELQLVFKILDGGLQLLSRRLGVEAPVGLGGHGAVVAPERDGKGLDIEDLEAAPHHTLWLLRPLHGALQPQDRPLVGQDGHAARVVVFGFLNLRLELVGHLGRLRDEPLEELGREVGVLPLHRGPRELVVVPDGVPEGVEDGFSRDRGEPSPDVFGLEDWVFRELGHALAEPTEHGELQD